MGGDQDDEQYEGNHEDNHDARSPRGSVGPMKAEQPEPTARRVSPIADPPEPDTPSPTTDAGRATSSSDEEPAADERFEPL